MPDTVETALQIPCPLRAQAWWGDILLAESDGAVRIERPGQVPELAFPRQDIDLGHLRVGTAVRAEDRSLRSWDAPDPAPPRPGLGDWWDDPDADRADGGVDVLRMPDDPGAGALGVFDHDRVRVVLLDPIEVDGHEEIETVRFPTWGDATDLVDLLDVTANGAGGFDAVVRPEHRRPVIEGSQLVAQSIVAAGRHAPGRRPVSLHFVFIRPADASRPVTFDVEEMTGGRTFTVLRIDVVQEGRRCATGTLLLDVMSDDFVRHHAPAPDVAGPGDAPSLDFAVTGRHVRVVDDAYTGDVDAPVGPPVIDAWVRYRSVPDDVHLHAGLVAHFTGHMSLAAAFRPHAGVGQSQAHRTVSTAVNAISMAFHADPRADEWLLYHHESIAAGDGMTRSSCRVHDGEGRLIATFAVDAMMRPLDPTHGDARTAM